MAPIDWKKLGRTKGTREFPYVASVPSHSDLFSVILRGQNRKFPEVWLKQHLDFPRPNIGCNLRLMQQSGETSGAVAAIQAWFFKVILFDFKVILSPGDDYHSGKVLDIRKKGLAEALTTILWNARYLKKGPVRLIVASFPANDDFDERRFYRSWQYCTLETRKAVKDTIESNYDRICRFGMVPFLCSLVMTRGIGQVKKELYNYPLVDSAGRVTVYTLINLILTGRAVPDLKDGPARCTEGTHPKFSDYGIISRSTIGMVSKENSSAIGQNYKKPHCPIWLVDEPQQFSVLFCPNSQVVDWEDLNNETFYWCTTEPPGDDDFNVQIYQQFQLAVSTGSDGRVENPDYEYETRYIKYCIRDLWPSARVRALSLVWKRED